MNFSKKLLLSLFLGISFSPVLQGMGVVDSTVNLVRKTAITAGVGLAGASALWVYKYVRHYGLYSDIEAFLKDDRNEESLTPDNHGFINIGRFAQKKWKDAHTIKDKDPVVVEVIGNFVASHNTPDRRAIFNSEALINCCAQEIAQIRKYIKRLAASTDFWKELKQETGFTKLKGSNGVEFAEVAAADADLFTSNTIKTINDRVNHCQSFGQWGEYMGKSLLFMPRGQLLHPKNVFYGFLSKVAVFKSALAIEYPYKPWQWHIASNYGQATKLYWKLLKRLACVTQLKAQIESSQIHIDAKIKDRGVRHQH